MDEMQQIDRPSTFTRGLATFSRRYGEARNQIPHLLGNYSDHQSSSRLVLPGPNFQMPHHPRVSGREHANFQYITVTPVHARPPRSPQRVNTSVQAGIQRLRKRRKAIPFPVHRKRAVTIRETLRCPPSGDCRIRDAVSSPRSSLFRPAGRKVTLARRPGSRYHVLGPVLADDPLSRLARSAVLRLSGRVGENYRHCARWSLR